MFAWTSRRCRIGLASLLSSVLVCALAPAAPTLAAPAATTAASAVSPGTVTLTAGGAAARELRRADARFRARGAVRTTTLVDGSTRVTLHVTSHTVSRGRATARLVGDLRLVRGRRSVRFSALRLTARTGELAVTAAGPGGDRMTVLAGRPTGRALVVDTSTSSVALRATSLRLSAPAARLVRTRLALRRVPTGTFASVAVAAGPSAGQNGASTSPGNPGTAGAGSGSGAGASNPGAPSVTPSVAPLPPGPPALTRPADAADIVSATVVWRVRESFIRYVNTGEGTSVSGGATADPAENLPAAGIPLVYQFRFPFARGWTSPGSGTAAVSFTGGVRFSYTAHTIDFTTAAPEIVIAGAASRAIFRLTGSDGTAFGGKRVVLVDLAPEAAAARTVSADGKTITYERIPARVPAAAGDSVFAGFYLAGDPFGWVSISYTTA